MNKPISDIKKLLGKKIKQIRKERGFTQEKLAELVNIEIPSLSNIETGKYAPSVETLQKLCDVFSVEPWELYCFSTIDKNKMIEYINKKLENPEKLKITYNFLRSLD